MIKPYYKKPRFTLLHGDSLELLKGFDANSIDMIFADPPYFLSNGTFTCHAGRRVSVKKGEWDLGNGFDENFKFHIEWIKACKRILKPNGTIWISGTYHSIYQCGYALQLTGYHILNDIAWFKPNGSPNLSCRYFTASHETLLWARKNKKAKHTFNYNEMVNWQNNYKKTFKCSFCGTGNRVEILHEPKKQMRSVWAINTPKKEEKIFGKHPTQKPLELLQRLTIASTNEGDLILDPFTGSSSTGLMAYYHKRKFIGIDAEKKYLDLSIKRFEHMLKLPKKEIQISLNVEEANMSKLSQEMVNTLREYAHNGDLKTKRIYIPDGCENHGFKEGYYDIGNMLQFLADMMEE